MQTLDDVKIPPVVFNHDVYCVIRELILANQDKEPYQITVYKSKEHETLFELKLTFKDKSYGVL